MIGCGNSEELIALIFDGGDFLFVGAGRVPPLVGFDAVSVRIGASTNGGVSRRGLGIGVVVVAVSEPCALIHEEIEAAVFELRTLAVKVVAPKLVDDDNDDKFWTADIRLGVSERRSGN